MISMKNNDFLKCGIATERIANNQVVYAIEVKSVPKAASAASTYAEAVGAFQEQDGSFVTNDVAVGWSYDEWSGKVEIEFSGRLGNVEEIYHSFKRHTGIEAMPKIGTWSIVNENELFG